MPVQRLSEAHSISLLYHDIFGYPMRESELARWTGGKALRLTRARPRVEASSGYFFLKNRGELVSQRAGRENASRKMMKVLSHAKYIFEENKVILMVGITGSLGMAAAHEHSDIDLLVVTRAGRLWSTRAKIIFSLLKHKVAIRRAGVAKQGDKLCTNIWMDESDLVVHEHNAYTAHELAQIVPLINRESTYEKLMAVNSWILDYWPNSVVSSMKRVAREKQNHTTFYMLHSTLEKVAYFLQRLYMSRKITREIVTPTRAFFHPFDWSKKVIKELETRGVLDKSVKSS
ncbi:hypothetical protein A2803_01040 [Candidatus Woesebacteria bacterium RIFCSPHIGHO2_01_FULL_44_21]|uniref:Polymerase nucleotidyl transferase domain-containing protein n=1 Tax=Candidatus Woesebacteria bacterium RIFCSPHIGHO2_01_FULL_44_21 TaxID=1802503 RepID=A0A1F7YX01_9BACT|nr:MAG: hypothetical protein A2803_01040 [Candidatus Woesebacteria bacterium RIFCSPHIGHO2_01_FULL_44_21]OGM69719.1 MAG: hypothetical protein A2897_00230 [Candidatus Woesebacteria bacterium RIFCSPLOWO2_01_FULL_44_24b]